MDRGCAPACPALFFHAAACLCLVTPGCALRTTCRVYLTPHIAGVTELSYRNMAEVVAAAVRRLRQGRGPANQLNAPAEPRGALL